MAADCAEISLSVITYNANGRVAPTCDTLKQLFTDDDYHADIIFVALQETPIALASYSGWSSSDWEIAVSLVLKKHGFVQHSPQTAPRRLGVHSLIFIARHLLGTINAIDVKTFHHSYVDNKSTVGVSLQFAFGTRITLVNTHMAAKPESLSSRIKDYHALRSAMQFVPYAKYISDDILIVAGDFNSRTEHTNAVEYCKYALKVHTSHYTVEDAERQEALMSLLVADQLLRCRRAGEMCTELNEAPITFPPTYRLLVGTHDYDNARVPSYCDRIMYRCEEIVGAHRGRSNNSLAINPVEYTNLPLVLLSDHIPVRGRFKLKLPIECLHVQWHITFAISKYTQFTRNVARSIAFYLHEGINYTVSAFDWIALYDDSLFTCDTRPVDYRYCAPAWQNSIPDDQVDTHNYATSENMTKEGSSSSCVGGIQWNMLLNASMFKHKCGRYRFGYYSKARNTLIGLSNIIEIIEPEVEIGADAGL